MIRRVYSSSLQGAQAVPIEIEVDCSGGIPGFSMVGLPDGAVREARERVVSALRQSGFRGMGYRFTVNLAPADLRKEGSAYDLGLALGLVVSSEQLTWPDLEQWVVLGELSLDGRIGAVKGVLPTAIMAARSGKKLLVPACQLVEVATIPNLNFYGIEHLSQCVERNFVLPESLSSEARTRKDLAALPDFADICGQPMAKRALEIAAAGHHHVLLEGPPGSGKSLCARSLPSILPDLHQEEILETASIHSCSGLVDPVETLQGKRPFRSPHHSASMAALVGGGRRMRPGEISLAHHGVLFLDEFPEFQRNVLESLRQPMEDGFVQISRASETFVWPSRFLLVAAMNPCPCGYANDVRRECRCSEIQRQRYRNRISGPLLDRIDLRVVVADQGFHAFQGETHEERSEQIRARVMKARERQWARLSHLSGIKCNGFLSSRETHRYCPLSADAQSFLRDVAEKLKLSGRSLYRLVKVACTIADLREAEQIRVSDISESLQFRQL